MVRARRTPTEALVEQGWATHAWLGGLPDAAWGRETVLPGWSTRVLLAHLVVVHRGLASVLGTPSDEPALTNAVLVARYAAGAPEISDRALSQAGQSSAADLLDQLATALDQVAAATATGAALPAVVASPRGPVTPADFVATRVLDVVVHGDDLSRTFADRDPVPLLRPALGIACRTLAEILATRHPGRSVEVRVPPYAAVQCSVVRGGVTDPGPTHTRGTPPNVVETDAVTFFRLCTGRTSWADALASGRVAASGLRADLSEMVPLLA